MSDLLRALQNQTVELTKRLDGINSALRKIPMTPDDLRLLRETRGIEQAFISEPSNFFLDFAFQWTTLPVGLTDYQIIWITPDPKKMFLRSIYFEERNDRSCTYKLWRGNYSAPDASKDLFLGCGLSQKPTGVSSGTIYAFWTHRRFVYPPQGILISGSEPDKKLFMSVTGDATSGQHGAVQGIAEFYIPDRTYAF